VSNEAPGSPAGLPERDVHYLKLLKTLKAASGGEGGGGELGVVRGIADWIDSVAVLNFVCGNAPWYDDWAVKEALLHNDVTPSRYRVELEKQIAIFDLLREMDAPDLSPEERVEIREDLKDLFKTLREHDRAVVKERALSLSRSRRPGEAVPEKGPAAVVAEAAEAPAPVGDPSVSQALLASDLGLDVPAEDLRPVPDGSATEALHAAEQDAFAAEWAAATEEAALADAEAFELVIADEEPEPEPVEAADLAEQAGETSRFANTPVAERVAVAAGSADAEALGALVYDSSEEVQLSLLRNTVLSDKHAAILTKRATSKVANAIYRERRLFMRPMVQKAFLHCPNAPSGALLEVVNSISDVPGLMGLIKSPKVKYLEVKAKARHRLTMIFRSLGPNEKMAALRRSGRGIIKELWTDFFRDEALVLRCIREKQIDSSTVLEIARSKIAPRKALEAIGNTPQYVANYDVLLQVVLNPKTPRQVVTKLIRRLNPSDRKMVKSNPSLPESIRRMA